MSSFAGTFRSEAAAVRQALDKSLAIIEFDPAGNILNANENFCSVMGYRQSELVGKHHSMFVEPDYVQSSEYRGFWQKLARGEFDAREYVRFGKGGKEVWIQASYNPVRGITGKVTKIVKVASDVTAEKLRNAEFEAKIQAISRAQAIIEFKPNGEIITANENFLGTVGYSLDEILGKHHRMFVDPVHATSGEYAEFWQRLNSGEFVEAQFRRVGKGGKEIWLQASYNPIFDRHHRVVKVVKFATDITKRNFAVGEIGKGLSALANGDVTHRIAVAFDPAFDKLRMDFNVAADKLHEAIAAIASATAELRTGSDGIAWATDDLSLRTEQQSTNLEETATALNQITETVRRSADGAKMANIAASAARGEAIRSGEVMKDAVSAMSDIAESSGKITQIIGVIDEIAFQINLLALNAGVEAARAGDAGRGFAIVAQEVRALAQRSAGAAKEIKTLIASSSDQVQRGVSLVGDTELALTGMVDKVTEIDALITDITHSAKEQAAGVDAVNSAVRKMEQITQKNATMVQEATAAAAALKSKSIELGHLVTMFAVDPAAGTGRPQGKRAQMRPAA